MLLAISCWIFYISAWFSTSCLCSVYSACTMSSVILVFSFSSHAREDWDFLELFDDLLCLNSLLLKYPFDDFLSVSALLNHLWIFLKVQTIVQVIKPVIFISSLLSSSNTWLYSSWVHSNIFNKSLNGASSFSTATLFLFEKRRSSIIQILTTLFRHCSIDLVPSFLQYCCSVRSTLLSELSFFTWDSIHSIFISLVSLWQTMCKVWIMVMYLELNGIIRWNCCKIYLSHTGARLGCNCKTNKGQLKTMEDEQILKKNTDKVTQVKT